MNNLSPDEIQHFVIVPDRWDLKEYFVKQCDTTQLLPWDPDWLNEAEKEQIRKLRDSFATNTTALSGNCQSIADTDIFLGNSMGPPLLSRPFQSVLKANETNETNETCQPSTTQEEPLEVIDLDEIYKQ